MTDERVKLSPLTLMTAIASKLHSTLLAVK